MSGAGETAMGPGGEFDVIRELLERWGSRARGIGDDAAVLDVPSGERLVVSTDAAVENVHFRRDWMSPQEIGWRAVAGAASDLAAMAARPLGIVFALALPHTWRAQLGDLAEGLGAACERFGIPIVGGNLSAGGELSITSTVVGSATVPVFRSGARPGDAIWVTGELGGPGAALAALTAARQPEPAHRERLVRPLARIEAARWLANRGARAMIDISDGLAADVGHMAAASGVRIVVDVDRVPVLPGIDPLDAMGSGEEYEIACAVPEDRPVDAAALERELGVRLTRIGRVEAGNAEILLVRNGARVASPRGHDHFSP